jgi:hypothetical protein
MLVAKPAGHPLPGIAAQVVEGSLGYAVPEVGGPAPQHQVELGAQGRKGLVRGLSGQRSHLCLDRGQGLLGRVGVDVALGRASLWVPLDAEPEEVEALVDVAGPCLGGGQVQPIGASTAATCSRIASAWALEPATMTTSRPRSGPAARSPRPAGAADGAAWGSRLPPRPGRRARQAPITRCWPAAGTIPPCGVPALVSCSTPSSLRMPALQNALTRPARACLRFAAPAAP